MMVLAFVTLLLSLMTEGMNLYSEFENEQGFVHASKNESAVIGMKDEEKAEKEEVEHKCQNLVSNSCRQSYTPKCFATKIPSPRPEASSRFSSFSTLPRSR